MTVKETKPIVKKAVDEMIMELIEKYGWEDIGNKSSITEYMRDEIGAAFVELKIYGKIQSEKERWC